MKNRRKPIILNNVIKDNKTVVHYTIQTNNFKLLKKLVGIDKKIVSQKYQIMNICQI